MSKLKLILFLLILAPSSFAVETLSCSTKDIEIKAAGFLGLGAETQKVKPIGRLTTRTSETSIYERSFEIGAYRFVKDISGFVTYRKNDAGAYEQKDIKGQVKVSNDHPIYVNNREGNTLVVRRTGDSKNQQEMIIVFGQNQISVKINKNGFYSEMLNYTLCQKSTRPQQEATTNTIDTGSKTSN